MLSLTGYKNKILNKFLKNKKDFTKRLNVSDLKTYSKNKIGKNSQYFINDEIKDENQLFEMDSDIPSVSGWIPFIKNRTSVLIYNFFSVNYSIRKNLVVKVSLLKNHVKLFTKFFTIKQYEIKEFKNIFSNSVDINDGIIVVEVFSPNISRTHGGPTNQFRFWGKYFSDENKLFSTVHSMPLSKLEYEKKKEYSRNYLPENNKSNSYKNISLDKNDTLLEHKKNCSGGYNIILNAKSEPLAIWHFGPTIDVKNYAYDITKSYQCFWVPRGKNLNPKIVLDPNETYIKKDEKQRVVIKILNENKIVEEERLEFYGIFQKNIQEIFNKKFDYEYVVLIEFFNRKFSYAQINYDNENVGDQIHSHPSNFFYNEKNELKHLKVFEKKNSRKFMHLDFNTNSDNYLIIHNQKIKNMTIKSLKLRYLDNNYNEVINIVKLDDKEILKVVNLNKIFIDKINYKTLTNAIVQLESLDGNFDATLISHDNLNDKIAVDHLTGG